MTTLICGSLAFDTIMDFPGRFADQILPEQLRILNVSFLVPTLRRDWGGCAGNIAYALRQLGGAPLPLATLGSDGADYLERLRAQGIRTDLIGLLPDAYTAQAMIMTDRDNNQITAFHPGAMARAHENAPALPADARLAIVSPDGREAMLGHAERFARAGIPFVFDPGQGLPMFDGAALAHFIELADWVAVNDYEARMLCERTGLDPAAISRRVKGLVITLGGEGCEVWQAGEQTRVPPAAPTAVVDPTGCGDAWRGALLFGLEQGWPLERCARLGNRVGALKVAVRGPQSYQLGPTFVADFLREG
jgi:adenosine kinase